MKDFIKFIVKFILIMVLTIYSYKLFFYVMWKWDKGPNAYNSAYQNALLRQYKALEADNREPEVIVFGASYVPFGIDIETLSNATGKQAQILGIEAGVGIPVLIDILYETAKPGDVIVYMLGGSNLHSEDFMTISAAFESDKEVLKWYWGKRGNVLLDAYKNKMLWRKMYAMTASRLVEAFRYSVTHKKQVYSIDSFDEKGNMVEERIGTMISTDVSPFESLNMERLDMDTMDDLNAFALWCEENDITFVIAYSMTMEGSIYSDEKEIMEYHKQVSDYMTADVLLTPLDYFLPVTDFYNHVYHLNTEGAIKYSTILGNALNTYLSGDREAVVLE